MTFKDIIRSIRKTVDIVQKRLGYKRRHYIITAVTCIGLIAIGWVAAHIDFGILFGKKPEPIVEVAPPVTYDEYDMPVDSFAKEQLRIRSDQYLSQILLERGISLATIDTLAKQYKYIFDVRDMKSGNNLNFYYTPDTIHQLKFMVYEKNASEYVVYDFRDSLKVSLKRKEIKTTVCYMEGSIKSSIWNAVEEQGVPIGIVDEITDVYQWMIDPFSLNRGDRFEVIYENQTVDNVSIGIGKVLAARFMYGKKWFEAYGFTQNGVASYFSETGESLVRCFLKAPLSPKSFHISSRFSESRMHPILRIRRPHHGVDYAAPAGTPVMSIGDGKVIQKGYAGGGGNSLKIKHNATFTTGYMHLRGYASGISVGSAVHQGQVIGYVGMTGLATGPHLDFRIWQNGQPVDPLKVESPPTEPVDKKLRPVYDSIVRTFQKEFIKYRQEGSTASDNRL